MNEGEPKRRGIEGDTSDLERGGLPAKNHPGFDSGIDVCKTGVADRISFVENSGVDYTGYATLGVYKGEELIATWRPNYRPKGSEADPTSTIAGWYSAADDELLLGEKYWNGKTLWDKQRELKGVERTESSPDDYSPELAKIEEILDEHEEHWFKLDRGRGTNWIESHYFPSREAAEQAYQQESEKIQHPFNEEHYWNGIDEISEIPEAQVQHLELWTDDNEEVEKLVFRPPEEEAQ